MLPEIGFVSLTQGDSAYVFVHVANNISALFVNVRFD